MIAGQVQHHREAMDQVGSRDSLLRPRETTLRGKILIVDDEPINIKIVQKYLREAGYADVSGNTDSRTAIDTIRREKPDVVVLDIQMPHISGLNILEVMQGDLRLSQIPVLILTATADEETKTQALQLGATDFLSKPVKPTELAPRIRNALTVKTHYDQMRAYSQTLEAEVVTRTDELVRAREELLHVLACAAEYRDRETGNHVLRVGRYCGIIGRQLGFSGVRVEQLEQAAILHDVGKIGIPDGILLKPGKLEPEEIREIQRHCEYGVNILNAGRSDSNRLFFSRPKGVEIDSPLLRMAARIAISHHEKWDGTGYPNGLAGEAIPIEGRITAVADVFDALSSERPYKKAFALDKCFEILREGRGQQFDPRVLDAFFARASDVIQVATELSDM